MCAWTRFYWIIYKLSAATTSANNNYVQTLETLSILLSLLCMMVVVNLRWWWWLFIGDCNWSTSPGRKTSQPSPRYSTWILHLIHCLHLVEVYHPLKDQGYWAQQRHTMLRCPTITATWRLGTAAGLRAMPAKCEKWKGCTTLMSEAIPISASARSSLNRHTDPD